MHIHAVRGRPKAVCGEKAPVPSTTLATLQGGKGRQSPPEPQATDRVPQPRCTERKGSNEALPPHVAAGPRRRHSPLAASDGAHSGGDSTPSERTQALAQSPTSERVICVPQKKSKFRASARPLLLWLRRQGTYKDSALPATKRSRLASCCFRWANTDRERSYIEPQLPARD